MTIITRNVLTVAVAVLALALSLWMVYAVTQHAYGLQTADKLTRNEHHYISHKFFSATTTTATSTQDTTQDPTALGMDIKGAKKAVAYLTHGGTATTSTGGAVFKVQVSPDRVTWYDFSRLLGSDVSETATSSVTIQGATSTVRVALDLDNVTYEGLRCVSTEINTPLGTDGEQSCDVWVQF